VEDLERLREDVALSQFLGYGFRASRATLEFLYQLHDEQKMAEAMRRRAPVDIHTRAIAFTGAKVYVAGRSGLGKGNCG
jgi:hypothetical protein